jgi:hypothetical protein
VPSASNTCALLCARVFDVETLSFPTPESLQGGNILGFLSSCGLCDFAQGDYTTTSVYGERLHI